MDPNIVIIVSSLCVTYVVETTYNIGLWILDKLHVSKHFCSAHGLVKARLMRYVVLRYEVYLKPYKAEFTYHLT